MKDARHIIPNEDIEVQCGFNDFIYGGGADGLVPLSTIKRDKGYNLALGMAKEGKVAFLHKFKCKCGANPFMYGGFMVCNGCGGKSVDQEWWKILVEKDGNSFCCHGLDFMDLQSSDNYAFGKTFEEAISEYEKVLRL